MRIYEESGKWIDEVAERAVGAGNESLVSMREQISFMTTVIQGVYPEQVLSPEEMVTLSFRVEQLVLGLIKDTIKRLEAMDALSPGTSNLLEGAYDNHEQFTYLLGQRTKTAAGSYSYDRR